MKCQVTHSSSQELKVTLVGIKTLNHSNICLLEEASTFTKQFIYQGKTHCIINVLTLNGEYCKNLNRARACQVPLCEPPEHETQSPNLKYDRPSTECVLSTYIQEAASAFWTPPVVAFT